MTTCTANQLEAKRETVVFRNMVDARLVKYDEIHELQDGYFKVLKKGSWGVITSDGEEVFPCMASTIYYVENGRVICGMDDDVYSIELKKTKKDSEG